MLFLPCLYISITAIRYSPGAREPIKNAYIRSDLAAARRDVSGMYSVDAENFIELYEGQWRSLESRRGETETFFMLRPFLKQTTAIQRVIVHGTRAVVFARRHQEYTIGYGSVGAMPPETPNVQYIHARTETVAEDEWRKIGSEWLRVISRPLSHKATFTMSSSR